VNVREFRTAALSFPGAVESAHMGHPDFRIGGRIFATLTESDAKGAALGMVKLTPDQQRSFLDACPAAFQPCSGAWGRSGCTNVLLQSADKEVVRAALQVAFENVSAQKPSKPRRNDKGKH
jgi:hypothetical protein